MHTVILPHALALVAPSEPGAMARIGTAIGDPDVPAAVYGLAVSLGSPTSLRAIGMPPDRLDEAAGLIVDAIPGTPKPFDIPAIRALLADAFEGRRPSLDRVVEPSTPR
jgi:alcohol dehydrogenase class IV